MTEARVPPYDRDSEEAIVGSILLNNEVLPQVAAIVEKEDFYIEAMRRIYAVIQELAAAHEPVDAVTLGARLRSLNELENVGGAMALSKLTDGVATTANVGYYARIVRDAAAVRRMIYAAQEIVAQGFVNGAQDAEAYLSRSREAVTAASADHLRGRQSFSKLKKDVKQVWDEVTEGKETPGLVKTGIDAIDRVTGGFYPGLMYVLAARPAMGKSCLALNIAQNVAGGGKDVGLMTLEDTRYFVAIRSLSRYADIDSQDLALRNVSPERYPSLLQAISQISDRRLWVDDTSGLSSRQIHARAALHKSREGMDLLIIDHLLEITEEGDEGTTARVTAAAQGARNIAKELNIPVLLLHQLNRGVEARTNKRPMLGDLKNTGKVEEAARAVWFLYRDGYYKDNEDDPATELIVAKASHGRTGMVKLHSTLSRMYMRGWDLTTDGPFPGQEEKKWHGSISGKADGGRPAY